MSVKYLSNEVYVWLNTKKLQNWTCTLKLFKQFLYNLKPPTQGVNEGNTSNKIFKPFSYSYKQQTQGIMKEILQIKYLNLKSTLLVHLLICIFLHCTCRIRWSGTGSCWRRSSSRGPGGTTAAGVRGDWSNRRTRPFWLY